MGAGFDDAAARDPVPLHLRDASYAGARKLGHGKGYRYPHDFPGHHVEQSYRPEPYESKRYFEPSGIGEDTADWAPGTGPNEPRPREPGPSEPGPNDGGR
jgi:putative ATPase